MIDQDQPMIDALNKGKAGSATSNDTRTQDTSIHNEARGAQIVQTNQLSTPVLMAILVGNFLSFAISCAAFGIAWNSDYSHRLDERNTQIIRNHSNAAEYKIDVLTGILQAQGFKLPEELKQKETDK